MARAALAAATILGPPALAQEQPAFHFPQGFHFYSASVFSSYYSALPSISGETGYDVAAGGSAAVGWSRSRPGSSISLSYSISYNRDITYSLSNSLNHDLSITLQRGLGPHWSLSSGLSAQVTNTAEFLFQPNIFSRITDTPATSDELASAILGGTAYDNQQLAALLTGAPLLESPARQLFFGDRLLNAGLQVTASYRKARLSVSFFGGGSRIQNISTLPGQNAESYLVPATTSGQAGFNVSYSLSPRTQLGVSVNSQRTVSRFEDSYTSVAVATLGRRMSPRWFFTVYAGPGVFITVRSVAPLPTGPQYLVGGSLGFKTASHSFLVSEGRTIQNTYGFGASSLFNTTAGWTWSRPGRAWKVFASGNQQQIHSAAFQNVNAWLVTAGFSRTLSERTAMTAMYAYLRETSQLSGLPNTYDTQGVRLVFAWTP